MSDIAYYRLPTSYVINSLLLSVGYNNLESKSLLSLFESLLSTAIFVKLKRLITYFAFFSKLYECQDIKY